MYTYNIIDRYDLQLFAGSLNTNVTTSSGSGNDLSPEMKTYYSDYLIDNAVPKLVHNQFWAEAPHPQEWRQDHRIPAV